MQGDCQVLVNKQYKHTDFCADSFTRLLAYHKIAEKFFKSFTFMTTTMKQTHITVCVCLFTFPLRKSSFFNRTISFSFPIYVIFFYANQNRLFLLFSMYYLSNKSIGSPLYV